VHVRDDLVHVGFGQRRRRHVGSLDAVLDGVEEFLGGRAQVPARRRQRGRTIAGGSIEAVTHGAGAIVDFAAGARLLGIGPVACPLARLGGEQAGKNQKSDVATHRDSSYPFVWV
jgi:hypothetical protein